MAIIKAVKSGASVAKSVNYVTDEKKTDKEKLVSGKDCSPETAIDEMKATKEMFHKTKGRQRIHLVQSFDPENEITPELAHEIGKKFAEQKQFKGHEVIIATHTDTDNVHNHFIINSVNFENGKKYQQSKNDLEKMKEYNIKLCKENGLSVPEKKAEIRYTQAEKALIENGQTSWKDQIRSSVDFAKNKANSYSEFKKVMTNDLGFKIKEGKDLTFTHPDNEKWKARGNKLGSGYERGSIENEFSRQVKDNERSKVGDTRTECDTNGNIRKLDFEGDFEYIKNRIRAVKDGVERGNGKDSNNDERTSPESSDLNRNGKQELRNNRAKVGRENNKDHDELESADRNGNDKPKPRIREIAEEFER